MARGENPGELLLLPALQTGTGSLVYDRNVAFGHASAGQDRALSIEATGANEGEAKLAADDDAVIGKLVEVHADGTVSYMPTAYPMLFRKSAADITTGQGIIGAGDGLVKTAATAVARGRVVKVNETGANGRILVLFP